MADEIAALSVRLQADIKQFERQTEKAVKTLNKHAAAMEKRAAQADAKFSKFGSKFGVAVGGLLTTAAISKFTSAMGEALQQLDNVAKSADKIGLTTDALQELRFAAELADVDAEALDKGLARLARTASDARKGLSTAVQSFDIIGVSPTDSEGRLKAIDVLLIDVADGFARMRDETQRAATAQELFGRSGTDLINLLANGGSEIERTREQARRFGIVVDEELIRKSEEASDKLTVLWTILSQKVTVGLANTATQAIFLGEKFRDASIEFVKFNNTLATGLFEAAGALPTGVAALEADLARIQGDIQTALLAGSDDLVVALRRDEAEAAAALARLRDLAAGFSDAAPRSTGPGNRPRIARIGPGAVKRSPLPPPRDIDIDFGVPERGGAAETAAAVQLAQLQERIQLLGQEQQLAGQSAVQQAVLTAAFEKQRILREFNNAAARDSVALTPEMAAEAQALANQFEREAVALAVLNEVLAKEEDAQRAAADAAREHEAQIKGIADAITNAITQADSFADALRNVAVALANILAQDLATKGGGSILGKLFSGAGSLIGGALGGGGGTGLPPPIAVGTPSAKGNVFSDGRLVPFAKGGIVDRPTVFPMAKGAGLMGEAGPEAILPLARGPDGRLGVRGGGGDMTVQIVNNAPVQVRDQGRVSGPNGEQVRRFVIEEVQKGTARGDFDRVQGTRFGIAPQRLKR